MKKITIFGNLKNLDLALSEIESVLQKHNLSLTDPDAASKLLITLEWKGGRGFDGIMEQFIIDKDHWLSIKPILLGNEIYFGEIAGKHSEVFGDLKESEITESLDLKEILDFQQEYGLHNNPKHSFLKTLSSWFKDSLYEYNKESDEYNKKKAISDNFSAIVLTIYK